MQRKRRIGAAVLLAMGAGCAMPAAAVRIDYAIDAGVEHNSNVGMDEVDEQSQNISQAGLGFTITEDTSAIRLLATGRADYLHYPDVYSDRLDAMLRGRFDWIAIPERLHLTVEDTMTTRPVDGLTPDTPANRQRLNTFSAGPTLFFRWAGSMQGAADLRYIRNTAEETRDLNATRVAGGLRGIHEFDATSRLSLNAGAESIDFDEDDVARDLDRVDAFVRYELDLASMQLGADAGWTRLHYDDGQRIGEPLFRVDVVWTPTARSRYTLAASSQFSDASQDGRGAIDPAAGIPTDVPVGEITPTSSQFEERRLELGYGYAGERFTFDVTPYAYEARYVDADTLDHDGIGVSIGGTWSLRPTLIADASASYDETDYLTLGDTNKSIRYGLGMRKQWTRNWSTRLSWSRYERRMSATGSRIDQDVLYLGVTYANR